jgi:hypothetical protein
MLANASPSISAYSNPTLNTCQICTNFINNIIPQFISQIESPTISSTNTANMVIYLNPAGYFEFAISNNTQTDIFSNAALYQNTAPDQSILFPISQVNSSSPLTFQGIIFYASAPNLDITPLENDMLQGNGLTPSNFENFVGNNVNYFYNSTVIISNSNVNACNGFSVLWCSIVDFFNPSVNPPPSNLTSILIDSFSPPLAISLGIINAESAVSLQQSYNYFTENPASSISFYQSQTNSNEPYSVSFNFEGQQISGTTTAEQLYTFNQDYDSIFSLNYYQSEYYSTVLPTLFFLTFITVLLLAFNGVSS